MRVKPLSNKHAQPKSKYNNKNPNVPFQTINKPINYKNRDITIKGAILRLQSKQNHKGGENINNLWKIITNSLTSKTQYKCAN